MTKPLLTLGIAGGTGAGKVRLRKETAESGDRARSRQHSPHFCNILSPYVHQSTLARSIFEELGGEEYVTYLVHDSYYKGKQDNLIAIRECGEVVTSDLFLAHNNERCLA